MLAAEVLAQADQQCVILVEQPHISRQVNWGRLIQKIYEVDPLRVTRSGPCEARGGNPLKQLQWKHDLALLLIILVREI
jgi:hypothetical protein